MFGRGYLESLLWRESKGLNQRVQERVPRGRKPPCQKESAAMKFAHTGQYTPSVHARLPISHLLARFLTRTPTRACALSLGLSLSRLVSLVFVFILIF